MTKVAINGFGRIGRLVFRALVDQGLLGKEVEVVAINDLVPATNLAYLLKYDSIQGRFNGTVEAPDDDTLVVNGQTIKSLSIRKGPDALPWKELGIDIVIESTGLFLAAEAAQGHIDAGAQKVILSAPGKGDGVKTVVIGVNDDELTADHNIVSNASCTTNCLAPITKVILENFGIAEGLMTTVHSYTATQKTVDGPSPKDMKGGRTAALNIIPSTTGAAKAVGLVIPELKGKLTGMSMRVPTPTGSVVDLTVETSKPVTADAVNAAIKEAADGPMKGILRYTDDPIVSSDIVGDPASSIFVGDWTEVMGDNMLKIISWYDNEMGYSCRSVDLIEKIAGM